MKEKILIGLGLFDSYNIMSHCTFSKHVWWNYKVQSCNTYSSSNALLPDLCNNGFFVNYPTVECSLSRAYILLYNSKLILMTTTNELIGADVLAPAAFTSAPLVKEPALMLAIKPQPDAKQKPKKDKVSV